jgi:putative ABC transport system ATP-binding protein
MMELAISMKDIVKSYGEGENKVEILKGVCLDIKKGEFVGILGPSGSGKSTLMNILGLIDTHDSGDYILEGDNIKNKTENEYAAIRNRKIGFIFQRFNLISKYSITQNVALPLLLRGEKSSNAFEMAKDMLNRVGLGDKLKNKPMQLSGGQQQRVAIARAVVTDANIMLADEPTGALDTKTGHEVMGILQELNDKGKTIILITHDLGIAKQTKRVIHVRDGNVHEDA